MQAFHLNRNVENEPELNVWTVAAAPGLAFVLAHSANKHNRGIGFSFRTSKTNFNPALVVGRTIFNLYQCPKVNELACSKL